MRILQITLPETGPYERKSQRIDQASLSPFHEVLIASGLGGLPTADVAHLYAPLPLPGRNLRGFPIPYLTSTQPSQSRIAWLRGRSPAWVISPLAGDGVAVVPEAVEDRYFDERSVASGGGTDRSVCVTPASRVESSPSGTDRPRVIGSFDRPALRGVVEQTLGRLHRFREDVTWNLFDRDPSPHDLDGIDAWVDPAVDPSDFDGFAAEALVRGLPVVAARTAINALRLENGRTGWLVPPGDPNELTHAILSALFKPELGQTKISAARQTRARFRSRQRIRVLIPLYEALRP